MNILILNWRDPKNPKAGGAEVVTLEHAKEWVKNGYHVTWFTSSFPGAKKKETIYGIEIVRFGNFLTVFFGAPVYYWFCNRKFDLVIDEFHGIPFFTPFFVKKKKIAFIHEVAGEIWKYMYPFPFSLIGRTLEFFAFKIYKHMEFITVSESTAKDLRRFGIMNVSIIINGLTLPKISLHLKKEDVPTFIWISRMVKMKGVEDVLEAFSFIHSKDRRAKLWIVGQGSKRYAAKLLKYVRQAQLENSVIFYGKVAEEKKIELMRRAHLLLHASIKEGWGLVVVEAASQGTPAVVYDVGGLRDSVKESKTGIVLKKNTPEEMAYQSLALLENKTRYAKFQKACIKFAKGLTWEKATAKSLVAIRK